MFALKNRELFTAYLALLFDVATDRGFIPLEEGGGHDNMIIIIGRIIKQLVVGIIIRPGLCP